MTSTSVAEREHRRLVSVASDYETWIMHRIAHNQRAERWPHSADPFRG